MSVWPVGAARAPQDGLVGVAREQDDLRVVGAQQPLGREEELADREAHLRRALRGAHRLVEELDVVPLHALLDVAAEREHARADGEREQEEPERPALLERDADEREAARRERADEREAERLDELLDDEPRPLGHRDHGGDEQRRRRRASTPTATSAATQRRPPPAAGERAEDEERDPGAERLLGEVEGELDRTLAAVDGEREPGADDLAREERERAWRRRGRRRGRSP